MRPVTLCTALVLSFAVLSLSTPGNASPIERLANQSTVAPAAPAKKPAVAKQAVSNRAAAKQRPNIVAATKPQPKKIVAARHQPEKTAAVTQPAKNTANQQPTTATQSRTRIARAAYAAVPAVPVTQFAHRADISSESLPQLAPQPTSRRHATQPTGRRMPALFASSDIVSEARRWIGTNPTNMSRVWCARFMNFVLERAGYSGTGSDAANSFAAYGRRVPGPQVGAIAVMTRGQNGGHVGVVSGIDSSGNPIVISGNHGRKVGEGVYSRSRVYAYVRPI